MIRHQFSSFNGQLIDLSDLTSPIIMAMENVEGMGEPESVEFNQETPLADGQQFTGYRYKAREVFWPILVKSTPANFQADNASLWSSLDRVETGLWIVVAPDGTQRTLSVRLRGDGGSPLASDPTHDGIAAYGITLVADDPYWKGATLSKTFQTAQDDLDFYAPPGSDYALWLSSASTVDNAVITNEGNVDSWAVIRVDGPAESFWVDQFFGDTVHPVGGAVEVPDGYYLEINTDPRKLSARLYAPGGSYTNVYRQMDSVSPFAVKAGDDVPVYIELIGEGSITISLEARFTRAI